MSHLLIGDLEPGPEEGGGQQPADGGESANVALTPQEVEARLDDPRSPNASRRGTRGLDP